MRFSLPIALVAILMMVSSVDAQIPRERASTGGPVDPLFLAPTIVYLPSLSTLPQGNLNVTIHHTFGRISDGVDGLFGLDAPANIRFGADYGVTDRISFGVGRSRFDKIYDFRVKAGLVQQTEDGRMPISASVAGNLGITTLKNGYEFQDRLSTTAMVLIGRRMSEKLSIQVTPMWTHFARVAPEFSNQGVPLVAESDHLALGIAARWAVTEVLSLAAEYIPVFGDRTDGTQDVMSFSLNIDTGGHVFQMFLTTSQGMTPQHVVSGNRDEFFGGDVRYGFNINRVFNFGAW